MCDVPTEFSTARIASQRSTIIRLSQPDNEYVMSQSSESIQKLLLAHFSGDGGRVPSLHVGEHVAQLLLARTFHFLHIMKVLFDRRSVRDTLQNHTDRQFRIGTEERRPARSGVILHDDDSDQATRGTIRGQEGLVRHPSWSRRTARSHRWSSPAGARRDVSGRSVGCRICVDDRDEASCPVGEP